MESKPFTLNWKKNRGERVGRRKEEEGRGRAKKKWHRKDRKYMRREGGRKEGVKELISLQYLYPIQYWTSPSLPMLLHWLTFCLHSPQQHSTALRKKEEKEKESKTATYVTIVCNTPSLSWKTIKRKPHPQVPSSLPHTHTQSHACSKILQILIHPVSLNHILLLRVRVHPSWVIFFSFKGFNHFNGILAQVHVQNSFFFLSLIVCTSP